MSLLRGLVNQSLPLREAINEKSTESSGKVPPTSATQVSAIEMVDSDDEDFLPFDQKDQREETCYKDSEGKALKKPR